MVNAAPNLNKINEAAEIRSPTRVEKLVCWIPLGPLCREGRRPSVTGGTCRSTRRHRQRATLSGESAGTLLRDLSSIPRCGIAQQGDLWEAARLTTNLDQPRLFESAERTRLRCAVNAERLEIGIAERHGLALHC